MQRSKSAKLTTATATVTNNDNNTTTAMITAASEVIYLNKKYKKVEILGIFVPQ